EVDPGGTISTSSNLIVRINNDQGARGTFQNKMNTQAMSSFCNPEAMLEKTTKILLSAQPPVVRTATHAALNLDRQPIGQSAIIAISSADGDNQEDSIKI